MNVNMRTEVNRESESFQLGRTILTDLKRPQARFHPLKILYLGRSIKRNGFDLFNFSYSEWKSNLIIPLYKSGSIKLP